MYVLQRYILGKEKRSRFAELANYEFFV
jgi:hypothetical protein